MAKDEPVEHTIVGTRPAELIKAIVDPPQRAYLIVIAGNNVGEMHRIEGPMVIGRGQDVELRILDDEISRRHAKLVTDKAGIFLEDLGSTNGTYVNGEPVSMRPLQDGDKIQVGATTILKFTYHDHLEEQFQRQMYESALRDPLTRAYNRKYLLDRLESEVAYALRHGSALSFILFDIDHFKLINDTHGHLAGDSVLGHLSAHVQSIIRREDVFARYGGEEFAVLSRGIDREHAVQFAERVRASLAAKRFEFQGALIPVTVSIGVSALPAPTIREPNQLIAAADGALYAAKGGGRNRVMWAQA